MSFQNKEPSSRSRWWRLLFQSLIWALMKPRKVRKTRSWQGLRKLGFQAGQSKADSGSQVPLFIVSSERSLCSEATHLCRIQTPGKKIFPHSNFGGSTRDTLVNAKEKMIMISTILVQHIRFDTSLLHHLHPLIMNISVMYCFHTLLATLLIVLFPLWYGGFFPEDLRELFPWEAFFLGTQRDYLMKEAGKSEAAGCFGPFLFSLVLRLRKSKQDVRWEKIELWTFGWLCNLKVDDPAEKILEASWRIFGYVLSGQLARPF